MDWSGIDCRSCHFNDEQMLEYWIETRAPEGHWSSGWKVFQDERHQDNYLDFMIDRGYKVEMYKDKPLKGKR